MGPPDGQQHYTERLVRLPNPSIYYKPTTSARSIDRRELALQLGIRRSGTRFWCGQSLSKYLPQYDAVFPRIARKLGDCQFIFIRYHGPSPSRTSFANGSTVRLRRMICLPTTTARYCRASTSELLR
jgi:predicted O-linked N-acetylglucosamine transferase (SPINDLY family)